MSRRRETRALQTRMSSGEHIGKRRFYAWRRSVAGRRWMLVQARRLATKVTIRPSIIQELERLLKRAEAKAKR